MKTLNPIIQDDIEWLKTQYPNQLSAFVGQTILITGANGFLCSYFVDLLATLDCNLIAVDNLKTGIPERFDYLKNDDPIRFIRHDVSQPLEISGPIDFIIHGAGIASPSIYRKFPLDTIDVNVNGTRHMLDLAQAQNASMLYLSTSEIYGDPQIVPTPEDYWGHVSPTGVRAPYDESKRLAETLCMTYFRQFGTRVKIARPFNVYGPAQRLDDKRIIPDLMTAALNRQPITLFSDGRPTRAFCYIRDAIGAMLFLLTSEQNGEVFNVGNDQTEISMGDLAKMMQAIAGDPPLDIRYETSTEKDYLSDNPQRRCPNIDKLKTAFAWQPHIMLREGLERTLESYKHE